MSDVRMEKGKAFYLAMYEKNGARWSANEHQELWCEKAEDYERRLGLAQRTGLDQQLARSALEFYADPFAWKKKHDPEDVLLIPDFYSETSFGDTAMEALAALAPQPALEADPYTVLSDRDLAGVLADLADFDPEEATEAALREAHRRLSEKSPALDPATVEACAKVADHYSQICLMTTTAQQDEYGRLTAGEVAKAIRALLASPAPSNASEAVDRTVRKSETKDGFNLIVDEKWAAYFPKESESQVDLLLELFARVAPVSNAKEAAPASSTGHNGGDGA